MTIEKFKLDNGDEVTFDTASDEFQAYERAALQVGITKKDDAFFFARELEFMRQKVFKPVYSQLKLIGGSILTLNTAIPEGAETDSYDQLDAAGEARVIGDFSDDVPTVEVFGDQVINGIKSIATGYKYSVQDMRRDKMLNKPGRSVVDNKALAARRALDQKMDKVLSFGDSKFGIKGMFNADSVPSAAVAANGTGSSTLWSTKTASNILDDIRIAIDAMVDISKGNEIPTRMLLDHTNYQLIKKKALDVTFYSGMSILKYVEQEYGLTVDWIQQLKGGFSGNASGFVLYNDAPDKLEGVVPIRLMAHAPQVRNLTTINILEGRCGGARVFYPYSMSYNTGI